MCLLSKVWYALKNYDNNLKKFSQIIDDYYSPLNYISPAELNITTSSLDRDTISVSFLADLKLTCQSLSTSNGLLNIGSLFISSSSSSSSSSTFSDIYSQTLAYLTDLSDNSNKKNNNDLDNLNLDSLHSLLNMSLIVSSQHSSNISNTEDDSKQKCWRVLLDALYFIFSQHYSRLFTAIGIRLSDTGGLVNRTILDLVESEKHQQRQTNTSVMIMPTLRDMRVFFDKYRRSKNVYSNSELKLCDPQPPILCNIKIKIKLELYKIGSC